MSCLKSLSAVACSFEFINVASEDYYLLKRNTPLEGIISQFIAVSYEGRSLEYKGIFVHRDPPTKDEFVLLKAGERITGTVQINEAFTLTGDGLYTIEYINPLMVISKDNMNQEYAMTQVNVNKLIYINLDDTDQLFCPVAEEEGEEEEVPDDDDSVSIESCSTASFTGGTQQQRSDILKGHKKLCSKFKVAKNKVKMGTFYTTWFGVYTNARAKKVKKVCNKCRKGLKNNAVTYVINPSRCQSNWNAFTSKGSKTVNLCPAYHGKGVFCVSSGAPTKEGILAHEWTHAFGRTDDNAYGETANKNLARTNPDKAVNNADTYEYWYCISQF